MAGVNPDELLEISPGTFKRLGDCTGTEIGSAIRLIARARIDRAWIDEQASGSDQGGLTIGRRFFANVTEGERDLIAYWQMVKLAEEQRQLHAAEDDARGKDHSLTDSIAGKTLIDQALATAVATDSGPGDRIALTREQALVWAIYLRAVARNRRLASDDEVGDSINAARNAGISSGEIDAAIASADRPEAREER